MSTFLFDSFAADKARPVLTVIGGNDKVNTSVDADNIADIGDITFLDIISYRDMQKVFTMLVYKFSSAKFVDIMVKIL